MKLDAHPRSMAFIAVSVGIAGIGIILAIAFFSNSGIMGAGLALAVIGIGLTLISCIHLASKRDPSSREKKNDADGSVAPRRIPNNRPTLTFKDGRPVDGGSGDDEDGGALVYDSFTAQPSPQRLPGERELATADTGIVVSPRDVRFATPRSQAAGGVVPSVLYSSVTPVADGASRRIFPLSPFERRSFPVPEPVSYQLQQQLDHSDGPTSSPAAGEASPPRPASSAVLGRSPPQSGRRIPAATVTATTARLPYSEEDARKATGATPGPRRDGGLEARVEMPPPRRLVTSNYRSDANGYTTEEMNAAIARNRDPVYEQRLGDDAEEEGGVRGFDDDDRLPEDYWRGVRRRSTLRPDF